MLKTQTLTLPGRDADQPLTLTELPALVADRYTRRALEAIGAPLDGGIVALTFTHLQAVRALGEDAVALLRPFVVADRAVLEWSNILAVQQAALLLHAGFVATRQQIEFPVGMVAAAVTRGVGEEAVSFCSPNLAAVLHSGRASYRELETVLSTEDAFNLIELLNIEAIRDWRASQTTRQTP